MFDTVLDEMFARDAALAVSQGCWVKCLKGVLEEISDRDAEWTVSQGCCIVCLTGMLDAVSDQDAGFNSAMQDSCSV